MTRKRAGRCASNSKGNAAKTAAQGPAPEQSAPAPEQRARALLDGSTAEWIAGSDEAGYGTLAGDLIVAAIAVPRAWGDLDVSDSKTLSPSARRDVVRRYRDDPTIHWVLKRISPQVIDRVGVWTALITAHNEVHEAIASKLRAVDQESSPLHIADGLENARARLHQRIVPLSKADQHVPAVSLASCFAKVLQCELMDLAAKRYPEHGFEQHRGYDTRKHREALARLGITPLHRKSYRTVRDVMGSDGIPSHRRR